MKKLAKFRHLSHFQSRGDSTSTGDAPMPSRYGAIRQSPHNARAAVHRSAVQHQSTPPAPPRVEAALTTPPQESASRNNIGDGPASRTRSRTRLEAAKVSTENCTICLCPMNEECLLHVLSCNHFYHLACITDWLKIKSTCPLCNAEV